jgi:hypothetical protein
MSDENDDEVMKKWYDDPDEVEEDGEEGDEFPDEFDPDSGDISTSDHRKFYSYHKLWLEVAEDDDYKAAVKAKMDREKFWPNVWFISDHGNTHLISLED